MHQTNATSSSENRSSGIVIPPSKSGPSKGSSWDEEGHCSASLGASGQTVNASATGVAGLAQGEGSSVVQPEPVLKNDMLNLTCASGLRMSVRRPMNTAP